MNSFRAEIEKAKVERKNRIDKKADEVFSYFLSQGLAKDLKDRLVNAIDRGYNNYSIMVSVDSNSPMKISLCDKQFIDDKHTEIDECNAIMIGLRHRLSIFFNDYFGLKYRIKNSMSSTLYWTEYDFDLS